MSQKSSVAQGAEIVSRALMSDMRVSLTSLSIVYCCRLTAPLYLSPTSTACAKVIYRRNSQGMINAVTTKQTSSSTSVDVVTSVAYVSMSRLTQSLTCGNGLSESNTYDLDSTPTRLRVPDGATNMIDRTLGRRPGARSQALVQQLIAHPAVEALGADKVLQQNRYNILF